MITEWNAGNAKLINAGKNTNGKMRLSIYLNRETMDKMDLIPGDIVDLGIIRKVGHEEPEKNRFKKTKQEEPKPEQEEPKQEKPKPQSNSNPVGATEAEITETKTSDLTEPEKNSATAPQVTDGITIDGITTKEKDFLEQYKNAPSYNKPAIKEQAVREFTQSRVDWLLKQ